MKGRFLQQGVSVTGRNRTGSTGTTGPPYSVGRPTGHAPGSRPARPPAALLTVTDDDDKRQMPASETILAY